MPVAAAVAVVAASAYSANRRASAANKAASAQAKSGQAAIDESIAAREQSRQDLQPYAQFGQQQLQPLQNMLTSDGQMQYLQNNPIFNASLKNMNEQVLNNAAVRGRLNAGDTRQRFFDNFQAAALPLLSYQSNNLFNAANMGQASAAGQANTSLTTGQNIGNTLTDIGNARASGIVGRANAQAGFAQDIVKGISSVYGGGYGGGSSWQANTNRQYGFGDSLGSSDPFA